MIYGALFGMSTKLSSHCITFATIKSTFHLECRKRTWRVQIILCFFLMSMGTGFYVTFPIEDFSNARQDFLHHKMLSFGSFMKELIIKLSYDLVTLNLIQEIEEYGKQCMGNFRK